MPLVGPWTDSTGTGYTYPAAYLVAHERIDTARQTVMLDITIWASSSLIGHTPIYRKTLVPTSQQIDNVINWIGDRADEALKAKPQFSRMSTAS